MSTAAVPPPFLNGASAVSSADTREAEFYQKILQIRDEVLASRHPRIHLPQKVIEQVAPHLPRHVLPARPTTNGTPNVASSQNSLPPPTKPTGYASPTQRSFPAKPTSSGIDPVLLTKSDHLIKAELQLKRQQIERQLKDQVDKKGRGNDADDREAHINVEECLAQAHSRVPPISGLRPMTNNSDGVESFDENSYYSSKVDSWSPEQSEQNQNANTDVAGSLTSFANQAAAPQNPDQLYRAEPTVIDLDEEAYEPADDIEIYEPDSVLLDDAEEEDYSPPPADVGPSEPQRGRVRDRGSGNRNGTNGSSRRQSPSGAAAPIQNPRKRRREDKNEKRRQQQANKRVVRSPEPLIKEEPQSPPPFQAYPDSQPPKRRALQPLPNEVEVLSPGESARQQTVYYREQEPQLQPYREYDETSSPTVIRMPHRRAPRDDQDLRRVASLQHLRRPHSPLQAVEGYPTPGTRQVRAASYAFIDRPEPPSFREASARPSAAPRYVRERSRSPVYEFVPRQQSPMIMAPPPRRIVMDQYGNKYYAQPIEARDTVPVDSYYERAVTREPTMRAPARNELYEDEPIQRMPPPPRRYAETSDVEIIEAPSYRQREPSRRPVEVEYRPMSQMEEMGPPREFVPTRSYSMRPEGVRREAPEGYVRHESIQPSGGYVRVPQSRLREVSVVHQEPFDDGRYISVPQSRRYVEEGPAEVLQDPYAGEPRRYARY